jgi:hypothetical protein
MKIKDGFMLREVAGVNVVVPVGERVIDFNGLMTLNDTGVFLWKTLEKAGSQKQMADMLCSEYEVSGSKAEKDVREFIKDLKDAGILE